MKADHDYVLRSCAGQWKSGSTVPEELQTLQTATDDDHQWMQPGHRDRPGNAALHRLGTSTQELSVSAELRSARFCRQSYVAGKNNHMNLEITTLQLQRYTAVHKMTGLSISIKLPFSAHDTAGQNTLQ